MNESISQCEFSVDDIEVGAAELNTTAQRCGQEFLAGFKLMTIQLVGEPWWGLCSTVQEEGVEVEGVGGISVHKEGVEVEGVGQGLVTRRYYWKPEVLTTVGHSQSHLHCT